MPRYAALGLAVAAGCLGPKSHDCPGNGVDGDGMTWVCPAELACAAPPTYCANPVEVGACDGKPDGAPCRTTNVPDGLCVDDACQMCSPDLEGCRAVGWNPMTVPSDTYKVVYAAGSGDVWAGGAELVHYDGAHWDPDATFPMLVSGVTVTAITGTSSHLFVGTNGDTIYHQVAGAWTATTTAAIAHGVWADGDDDAFAAGGSGDIERFAGSGWTPMPNTMTTKALRALWGSSASDVYAVGDAGTIVHYDGSTWSAATAGTGTLSAVWGSGPTDVYVAGASGIFHSTDGATWTPEDATDAIGAIWGSSATDVFAAAPATGILHSDGGGLWVPLVSPTMVSGLSGSGPADAFAAAGSQILHYTGSCWSSPLAGPAAPPATGYSSVSVISPTTVFAAGDRGALDRFDGSAWSEQIDGTMNWVGVWARAADDAYAVGGGAGGTQIDHWDGSAWTSEPNPSSATLAAVSGSPSSAYAVGAALVMGSGGTWSIVLDSVNNEPAVWVAPDDGSVFYAGDQIYVNRGGASDVLLGSGGWTALWGASSSDVFAAGLGGQLRHFDGTSWSDPMDTPTTVDLAGLWGTSDDDVFAVGASGTLLHYHAQLWTIVPPPAGVMASFRSVGGSGSTIFVVGADGTVARLIESAP